tara:strand:- start:43681 stop:44199 length:519 start_codon:yes stop_codon:yes gene_type:complete
MEKYIKFGHCSKPHGIKGAFSFHLFNKEDSSLKKGSKLILRPSDSSSSIRAEGEEHIIGAIAFGNKVIVSLKNVQDRNQVEAMIPFEIYVNREDFPPLSEDEYYIEDLVGLKVKTNDGVEYGVVDSYYDNGAQTVLVIKGTNNIELPLVEQFFPEVNVAENYILINEPEEIE